MTEVPATFFCTLQPVKETMANARMIIFKFSGRINRFFILKIIAWARCFTIGKMCSDSLRFFNLSLEYFIVKILN